jgi:serine/threonine-protein kinase CLA4
LPLFCTDPAVLQYLETRGESKGSHALEGAGLDCRTPKIVSFFYCCCNRNGCLLVLLFEMMADYSPAYSIYTPGQFMNPGPAPRPPTERPRLNLTPSTSNVPGNMSSLSINSPITRTATSTYTGNTVSLPLAQNKMDGSGGVAVIKEGWASVKEGKNFIQPWKQKWLILRKEQLDFHKTEGGKISYSVILKDVLGVSRVEAAGTIFEIKRALNGQSTNPGDDDGISRTLQIKVKGDDDLYEWIDYIYARCPGMGGVSNPTNFSHSVHVGFDPNTGEFVGLPPEWSKLLNSSAITKEDYERNPQAVFEVLEFYSDITKRAQNPMTYPSLTPTPPVSAGSNKQLGYGMSGANVAPPRPIQQTQRNNSFPTPPGSSSSSNAPRRPTPPESQQQRQQMQQMASNYVDPQSREEQRQKQLEAQRQRDREIEEQNRRDMEAYNASLPKTRPTIAQQEIGGFGGSATPDRYNPSRAPPPAPRAAPQPQAASSLRTQRQAPSAPTPSNGTRPPMTTQQSSSSIPQQNGGSRSPARTEQSTQRAQEPRYQNGPNGVPPSAPRAAANGNPPPSRLPAPVNQVKPLNVANKQNAGNNGIQQNDAVKAAEAALTAKPPTERKQDVRMSTMSENEVMAKLKEAVSKDDPNLSYSKQKKIGQGASGSVYVAKVKENPASPIAREVIRQQGSKAQVAIKQMDLAHQPRKELIVNEIMVMKDSKHRNIVNFLDAFLRNNSTELWVVMEYMEGGALTDVIDNNPTITEDQISTICLEVSIENGLAKNRTDSSRPAVGWNTCTINQSSTVTSRVTTSSSMPVAMSRSVSFTSPDSLDVC